jgi:hypothetical protein
MGEPKTWAEVKTRLAPPIERVQLCARPDLVARIEDLKNDYEVAVATDELVNEPPKAPGIAEEIERLRAEALGATVTFTFQGVPHHVEDALREQHQPSPEQKAIADRDGFRLPYNPETFIPALLSLCCTEPTGMTAEDWTELYTGLTDGQAARFRMALNVVNHGVADIPKGVSGSEKTGSTATS